MEELYFNPCPSIDQEIKCMLLSLSDYSTMYRPLYKSTAEAFHDFDFGTQLQSLEYATHRDT